jgi:hypothetical protein
VHPVTEYYVQKTVKRDLLVVPAAKNLAAELRWISATIVKNQLQEHKNIILSTNTSERVHLKMSPILRGNDLLFNVPPIPCRKIYITVEIYGIFICNDNVAKLQFEISEWEE